KRRGRRQRTRRDDANTKSTAVASQCQLNKWLFLFVYSFIASLSNTVVHAYIHDFVVRQPLPDVLHSVFPEHEWAYSLSHCFVKASFASFCFLLIFHKFRAIVARRFLFIGATLFSFRCFTLVVTQLPS
ncbi:hypothetical protein OSTOST_02354, partial [Ostertagia ostertagi]